MVLRSDRCQDAWDRHFRRDMLETELVYDGLDLVLGAEKAAIACCKRKHAKTAQCQAL